ncbi:MAG: tRNA threonylcarbamoyladenosine dehydratase [Peptococcaceae bacterium]|nr:tRNA threonylcarbamoyladenosine dehydratase [Peptococcaceae bacterium]
MEKFYDRTLRLLGKDAIIKLEASHVIVLGIGGVGSWVCEVLVRSGIGELTLVDYDSIEISNINRQIHALHSTVGQRKVDAMAKRLLNINPNLKMHVYQEKITEEHLPFYLMNGDYTIDCIDDVRAKVALILWHLKNDKKIISSMGTGNKIGTYPFKISDISKTSVCPLARVVRKKLREEGITSGVQVLYSEEPAYTRPPNGEKPGTICFAPAMAGLELAKFVVNQLL